MQTLIKKLCMLDDNLLSFLCGIFSNIPISLLFAEIKWGDMCFEHIYFVVWIITFFISIALTICAFSFTMRKIKIQKIIDSKEGETAQNETRSQLLEESENKNKLFFSLLFFFVFGIALLVLVVSLWAIRFYT